MYLLQCRRKDQEKKITQKRPRAHSPLHLHPRRSERINEVTERRNNTQERASFEELEDGGEEEYSSDYSASEEENIPTESEENMGNAIGCAEARYEKGPPWRQAYKRQSNIGTSEDVSFHNKSPHFWQDFFP